MEQCPKEGTKQACDVARVPRANEDYSPGNGFHAQVALRVQVENKQGKREEPNRVGHDAERFLDVEVCGIPHSVGSADEREN